MIYKQRNLLSFVLVTIVERAQETFSVLANVPSCQDQSKAQRQRCEIPNADTKVSLFTLCMLRFIKPFLHRINEIQACFRNFKVVSS